jgi:hypothetical protein
VRTVASRLQDSPQYFSEVFSQTWNLGEQILSIISGALMGVSFYEGSLLNAPVVHHPSPPMDRFGNFVGNAIEYFAQGALAEWQSGAVLINMIEAVTRLVAYVTGVITAEMGYDFLSGQPTHLDEAVEGLFYSLADGIPIAMIAMGYPKAARSFVFWLTITIGPEIIDEIT